MFWGFINQSPKQTKIFVYLHLRIYTWLALITWELKSRKKKSNQQSIAPAAMRDTVKRECLIWIWRERNVNILLIAFYKPMLHIWTIKIFLTIKNRIFFLMWFNHYRNNMGLQYLLITKGKLAYPSPMPS